MTEKEEEVVWEMLLSTDYLIGLLACTISEDPDHRKWLSITAKDTRDKLIEIQDKFIKDIGMKP